jgi:hypothetical protein
LRENEWWIVPGKSQEATERTIGGAASMVLQITFAIPEAG